MCPTPDVVEPNHVEHGDRQKNNSENTTVLFMGTLSETVHHVLLLDIKNTMWRLAERKNVYWQMHFIMRK